jgi:hypothetical protein
VEEKFAVGGAFGFGGTAPFEIEAGGQFYLFSDTSTGFPDEIRNRALVDIAGDGLAAAGAFVLDGGAAIGKFDIG